MKRINKKWAVAIIAVLLLSLIIIIIFSKNIRTGFVVKEDKNETKSNSVTGTPANEILDLPASIELPADNQNAGKEIFDELQKSSTTVYPYQVKELHQKNYVSRELADQAIGDGRVRIIVRLKNDDKKQELINLGLREKKEFNHYISGTLVKQKMVSFIKEFGDENIDQIALDHIVSLAADSLTEQISADQVWDSGFTGKGQSVCVIDSGIDYNHPSFAGKYAGGYDFVNNSADPLDDNGHGTYVSGIVARIAPDAKIIAVKVFNKEGKAYESDIIAGIDYCVQNKEEYNISIILMAFGGGIYDTSCYCDSNFVSEEANYAINQGIFAVAASGNEGDDYLKAPGCGSNVTSVGAVDNNDDIASFTNIEPLLDLLAPGVGIESAKMGGGFESRSGTSSSAAAVAGVSALLLEKENFSPLELLYRLKSTGRIINYQGTGYPRVDSYAALMNDVTNTPDEQEGTQCEGTWEEYETLASSCSMYCEDQCADFNPYYYLAGCAAPTYLIDCSECDCATSSCNIATCGAQCNATVGCGNGMCNTTACVCNNVTNCATGKCFTIKNSTGSVIAKFDGYGNLDLKGRLKQSQTAPFTPPAGSFIIKNYTGNAVAYFNASGSLWLDNTAGSNFGTNCTAPASSLVIKNSTGACVAYISSSGVLWLKGMYLNYTPNI